MMNRRLTIVNIVLWSLVLVAALFTLCKIPKGSNNVDFKIPFTFSWRVGDKGEHFIVKDIQIKNDIVDISLDWIKGNLSIKKSANDEIRIVQLGSENLSEDEFFSYKIRGKHLIIKDERKGKVSIGLKLTNSSDLELYLPEKEFNTIVVNTISSDIYSEHLKAKSLTFDTISGNINVIGEFLESCFKTISGKIQSEGLDTKKIAIDTTSGNITIDNSHLEELDLKTISGDSKIRSLSMIQYIKFNSVSGNATITIPDNDGFTIDFTKVSGKLKSDFALTIDGNEHAYKNGTAKIKVSTVSGNFEILKQ